MDKSIMPKGKGNPQNAYSYTSLFKLTFCTIYIKQSKKLYQTPAWFIKRKPRTLGFSPRLNSDHIQNQNKTELSAFSLRQWDD